MPASLPPAMPLAPCRPPLPTAAPLYAKPASDPSNHCRTGQVQPSATPPASLPRPPCLTTSAAATADGHLAATTTVATSSAPLSPP
uniref:Uncharacterized protein n=1 Tax=Oryza glumipatula TaxID=40148 RepID=A0A0E0AHI5_9ORYZ